MQILSHYEDISLSHPNAADYTCLRGGVGGRGGWERGGEKEGGGRKRRPDILLIDPKGQMLPIIRTLY